MKIPSYTIPALAAALILLLPASCTHRQQTLEDRIHNVISGSGASVGAAVIIDGRDTVTVNNDTRYPMMSVFKFHQAIAAAHRLQGTSPDTLLGITPDELRPDMYSPLRETFPEGTDISLSDLLGYTLCKSDNNACDIIFSRIASPAWTDSCIRSLGISDFAIARTEADMHDTPSAVYDNWTTPLAAADLLDRFITGRVLSGPYYDLIYNDMTLCATGASRLCAPIPDNGTVIGHKTGTSDPDQTGKYTAVNDIAFVQLPDGRRYTVAVFVCGAADIQSAEKIISDISSEVYSCITADKGPYTLGGTLVYGHEVRSFSPDGSPYEFWAVDTTGRTDRMYDSLTSGVKNGIPVRAVLEVGPDPRPSDGFAAEYDGSMLIYGVKEISLK